MSREIVTEAEMREKLAALAHEQWAGWMHYLFLRCHFDKDGHGTMPMEWVQRWRRQAHAPYEDLTEAEKDSDRKEADRVLEAINFANLLAELQRGLEGEESDYKPWVVRRRCDRRKEHAGHTWVQRCPCRETNPTIQRHEAQRVARHEAKATQ